MPSSTNFRHLEGLVQECILPTEQQQKSGRPVVRGLWGGEMVIYDCLLADRWLRQLKMP